MSGAERLALFGPGLTDEQEGRRDDESRDGKTDAVAIHTHLRIQSLPRLSRVPSGSRQDA